jgi:hypothetical protein
MLWLDEAPPVVMIRNAAQSVLSSRRFKAAPRLASFLRFVVDATLQGRSAEIKGYTIGVEALGRPISFDPSSDSIVRVEAVRLRAALRRFYLAEGATQAVEISIPVGTYVPKFSWLRENTESITIGASPVSLFPRSKADFIVPSPFSTVGTKSNEGTAKELAIRIARARRTLDALRHQVQVLTTTREHLASEIEEMTERSRRK